MPVQCNSIGGNLETPMISRFAAPLINSFVEVCSFTFWHLCARIAAVISKLACVIVLAFGSYCSIVMFFQYYFVRDSQWHTGVHTQYQHVYTSSNILKRFFQLRCQAKVRHYNWTFWFVCFLCDVRRQIAEYILILATPQMRDGCESSAVRTPVWFLVSLPQLLPLSLSTPPDTCNNCFDCVLATYLTFLFPVCSGLFFDSIFCTFGFKLWRRKVGDI